MNHDRWTQVDRYLDKVFALNDEALEAALITNKKEELPNYDVSPAQGRFLQILASSIGAKRILEVGTLGGYSSICLARALPKNGRLISLELLPHHAEVARKNIERAGLSDRVEVRVGPALDLLAQISSEKTEAFDLSFIDADKSNNTEYFKWALKLSRPGSLIIVDNVIRDGALVDVDTLDANAKGAQALHEYLSKEKRVNAVTLQTVGVKGYDGFAIARVL